jgi:putative thioredoxin
MIESIDSPYILSANSNNFQQVVLENSKQGPVLVNFCSKQAVPCLHQYPILDQIIHHYDGRALLVNVDADTEATITTEYSIASVPTLMLFRNEAVVETMNGFQSAEEIMRVMEQYVARDSDMKLIEAIRAFTEGKATDAYEMIAKAIVDDPVNPRLPLTMCKLLKHEERYPEALKLIESLPEDIRSNKEIMQFHDLLSICNEADTSQNISSLAEQVISSPKNIEAKQQLSVHYIIEEQFEKALQQLSEMMEIDANYRDNYAQKSMIKVFNIIGSDSDLASRFKPNLKRFAH